MNRKQFQKHFRVPRQVVIREDYILDKCKQKRVLHLGCIGKAEGLYEELMVKNAWLHARIRAVAAEVVGIDNAHEIVSRLRSAHGVSDIYVGDAHHLENLDMGLFDIVMAGEIIEHLPYPGLFLASAHHVLNTGGQVLITTTNAFCTRRFLGVLGGFESVHEDHVAYYSHRTLERLGEMTGYRIVEQASYRVSNKKNYRAYLMDLMSSFLFPGTAEGLICVFEKNKGAN
jgi:2-polyprenyl-3-methyl-5-hydroxy-6-metoxy-1,4-benzoquinol methylase